MSNIAYTSLRELLNGQFKPAPYRRKSRGRVRRRERLMKAWVYDGTEINRNNMTSDVFIGASDLYDYIACNIQADRNEDKQSTEHNKITVLATSSDWLAFMKNFALRVHKFNERRGFLIDDKCNSYLSYEIHSTTIEFNIHGEAWFVEQWTKVLQNRYEVVHNSIEWIYNSDGASIEVPLRGDRFPCEEMYPWLGGESLTDYYDRYAASDASILLLIGPPGTGKTTFIRGLLQHTKQSAVVTYDPGILSKDFVFAQFIEGEAGVFVIEDADTFLGSRDDGNDVMHKFLNVGDGLVTTKNKKMIFSTNLPSIHDIDPALLRPGRCFDIVNFNLLNTEQAIALAKRLDVEFDRNDSGQYSIAEVFNKQSQSMKKPRRSVGFV